MSSPSFMSPESKPGQRPKLEELEQLFMFFTWLRLGFTQVMLDFCSIFQYQPYVATLLLGQTICI